MTFKCSCVLWSIASYMPCVQKPGANSFLKACPSITMKLHILSYTNNVCILNSEKEEFCNWLIYVITMWQNYAITCQFCKLGPVHLSPRMTIKMLSFYELLRLSTHSSIQIVKSLDEKQSSSMSLHFRAQFLKKKMEELGIDWYALIPEWILILYSQLQKTINYH